MFFDKLETGDFTSLNCGCTNLLGTMVLSTAKSSWVSTLKIEKPHVTQIKNSWRTKENWMSYEFVKVTLPSALENFQGFLGQRYLAYPEGDLGRIPILAYFNGILKVMTGTVWPRGTAHGVSIVELMEIIEPNHLCGERHLCSVQAESLSFWPEMFQARPGSYIHVKQVNIDDDSEEEGTSSTSSCSTRWHESFGENGTSSAEDEQVQINNEEAFIHEEQNLNEIEDSYVMMQVQSSAGVFPERMRERSNALWERTMAVHHEQQRQWAHERETVENTLRVFNQELIMEEINGLALRNQGHVTCYLMGIANYQIGTRVINVNVWDLQDFVDLGVLIKRQWNDHANFGEWNLHFVDPQPPPEVHQNWDGITLICDLIPNHQNMPIAILTTTYYGAEDNSMDLSVHRARLLLNCRHLQEVSGVRMLCLHNAECSCMYASRPVTDSTPIIAFAGYRIDVKIDMHIGRCDGEALLQGGEETSLMQLEGRPTTRSGPWVYGYPLLAEDVIRAWKGAIGDTTPQRLLANEHARHRQLMHHQIRVYKVFPIPVDLAEANIEAYVLAAEDDFEIWKVIILVDLYWEHTSMEGTGGSSAPIDQWRATRAIDYQLDVTTFLRQMGVLAFCGENLEFCEVMIRGNPWTQGTLHFHSGEFVVVRISRAHTTIPLGTQWQLSSNGCTFEDMPARLGPPSTRTTEEETRSEEDGNQNQNNRTENREAPSSSRGSVNLAEDDQFTLMQRLPRESWFFVYLKGMHDPIAEKLTGVELEDPVLALREKFIARFPDVPRNFVMMFMLVTQPTDLQAMQTVGVIHALANEIPRGKAIIMLDLEFYENHRPHVRETPFAVAEWREVLETEERQTRREFLRRVGLHDFCLGKKDKCLVTHRGESWQTQDNSQRLIRDGDYVLVKVQKKNPKQTIQEQWSRANGQCERAEDSQYVQRLLR